MKKDTVLSNNNPVTILVVGAGAVGGFYGCRLSQAGAEVSTVHRSDYEAVRQKGITIDSIDGPAHFHPQQVLRRVADYQGFPDYLLVSLKSLPELDIASLIAPAVGPDTTVILLQNGIQIEEPVQQRFPSNEIISGLAFICVNRIGPGMIRHLCYGRLMIGCYPEGISPAVRQLSALFERSNVPCHTSAFIVTERWRKLLWNAPYNPISVLAGGVDTQQIMAQPDMVSLIRGVMEEVLAVALSLGHNLTQEAVEKNLDDTHKMKPYRTSMLLDYESGRPMEVEAILGNIIKAAEKKAVRVVRLQTLYSLLKLKAKQPFSAN
ncbi:MAG: 2-dehydropantoate 2-reductase [Magnetococcales bacterium]|nr:2-dehydropantoate 2-reductase [Magnetococcales bacterium]